MADEGDQQVTQILNIDPEQLAQLLSQSADGTAQLIDEHGNTITVTAEQFAEAGLSLQSLAAAGAGASVLQLQEGQYVQGEDGQFYLLQADSSQAQVAQGETGALLDASGQQAAAPAAQMGAAPAGASVKSAERDLLEEYKRLLHEREAKLMQMEQKLKETHEQNVLMAQALASTCDSEELEVVVQNPDGTTTRRQIVSVHKGETGRPAPTESYLAEEGGEQLKGDQSEQGYSNITSAYKRSNLAFQESFLPHPCDQCPRRFAQESHLKRHLEVAHAKRQSFFCQYCNKDLYLASEVHFQGHLRMQHKREMEADAAVKQANLESGVEAQTGFRNLVEEGPEEEPDWAALDKDKSDTEEDGEPGDFKCTLCNKEYASIRGLKKHAKDEHDVTIEEGPDDLSLGRHRCEICSKIFQKRHHLDKHKLAHSEELAFPCQYCIGKSFRWKENLLKHLAKHMERMPFKCMFCNQGFPSQIRLDVHQKSKHGHSKEGASGIVPPLQQQQRDHACPICQKSFFDKDVLTKHMRIHGGTVFPCPECDKKFISEKFLRNHMTVHTQIRDFTCEKCGKFFNSASLLKAHRFVHGERPYKCRACCRTFRRVYDLRSHEKVHTEIKTHHCNVCGRNFRQKINLELHLRVHRGLKPFQCSSCRKSFNRLHHLQTHVNAHRGVKPHPCPECDKAFSTPSNLKQHLLLHQGHKPFQCGACGRAFFEKRRLLKHVKSHTTDADVQYVIIWEKGGVLTDATIITDGAYETTTLRAKLAARQPLAEKFAPDAKLAGGVDAQQQQPVPTFTEQGAKAKEGVVVNGLPTAMEASGSVEGAAAAAILDPSTLLALADAQGEDGTIYISEENLQALAQQGVVFSYQ